MKGGNDGNTDIKLSAKNMTASPAAPSDSTTKSSYNRLLLFVAGLGGLLYGVDVGIIAGALPYLEATSGFNANQLSSIVAAVLLGSVFSTLFAGMLADKFGRKSMMAVSGILFVISIPLIALAHGYGPLIFGRLLQGISGGLIGVVIPLYLAECLGASSRGKGTGIFQWMLVMGLVAAALIGTYFSIQVDAVAQLGDAAKLFAYKESAWRSIFWVSLPPGILFILGIFFVSESPRWLYRRGNKEAALNALLRSRTEDQARTELKEMDETAYSQESKGSNGAQAKDSLLHRKYLIPFGMACVILACNQATGINSIIGYNTTILIQAGLSDKHAHMGSLTFNFVNFLATIVAVALVDRKGRKFLLSLGTAGIIVSLVCAGWVFSKTETQRVDVKSAFQQMVTADGKIDFSFSQESADKLLATAGDAGKGAIGKPTTMVVIYSCGDYVGASSVVRSDDPKAGLKISRESCLPSSKVESFFKNPFANLDAAQSAPLKIENALITPVPSEQNGWITATCLFIFMAFYAVGPGVCVWLALSELMPTRIRSNGMSFALLINQAVSTTIAAVFLPSVGKYGYATMFYIFAGCTVVYFITAAFFLPETKGKTLEEIEEYFEGKKS